MAKSKQQVKKQPKKYQLIAVNEDDSIEVQKEAVSLHSLALSDIEPGSFPVTFVSKDDIRYVYRRCGGRLPKTLRNTIDNMTDADMADLADDMENAFADSLFWDAITDNMDKFVERYHARVRDRAKGGTPP